MALNINTKIVNNLTGVVADASSIKGGYLSVDYYADLENLPSDVVHEGSLAYVLNSSDNLMKVEDWAEFQSEEDYINYYIFMENNEMIIKVTNDNLSWLLQNEYIILGKTPCSYSQDGDLWIHYAGFYRYTGNNGWQLDIENVELPNIYLGEFKLDFEQSCSIPVDRNFMCISGENNTIFKPVEIDVYKSNGDSEEFGFVIFSDYNSDSKVFIIGGEPMLFVVNRKNLDNGWFTFSFKPLNTSGGKGIYTVHGYHELEDVVGFQGDIAHVLRSEPGPEVEGWEEFQSEEDYIGYAVSWGSREHETNDQSVVVTNDNLVYLQENEFIVLGQTPCYEVGPQNQLIYDAGFYICAGHGEWILLNTNELYEMDLGSYEFSNNLTVPFSPEFAMLDIYTPEGPHRIMRPVKLNLYDDSGDITIESHVLFGNLMEEHIKVFDFNGSNYTIQSVGQGLDENGMNCIIFSVQPLGSGGGSDSGSNVIDFGTFEIDPDAIAAGVKPEMTFSEQTNSLGHNYVGPVNPAMIFQFDVTEKLANALGMTQQEIVAKPDYVIDALAGHQIKYNVNFYLEESGEGSSHVYEVELKYSAVPLTHSYYKNNTDESASVDYLSIELMTNFADFNIDDKTRSIAANYKAQLYLWSYSAPKSVINPSTGDESGWALILYNDHVILPMTEELISVSEWFENYDINYLGRSYYKAPVYFENSGAGGPQDIFKHIKLTILHDRFGTCETIELDYSSNESSGIELNEREITSLYNYVEGEQSNTPYWAKMYAKYNRWETDAPYPQVGSVFVGTGTIEYSMRFKDAIMLSMINTKNHYSDFPECVTHLYNTIIDDTSHRIYRPLQLTNTVFEGVTTFNYIADLDVHWNSASGTGMAKLHSLTLEYDSVNKEFSISYDDLHYMTVQEEVM